MHLEGQEGQRGYAMAAVLVALAVLSVVMTALLPVWRQQAQREKEAELLFRGAQYARAIQLYRNKNGNNYPPNIDILVQQKYLRKKYTDPITGEDFQPLFVGQQPSNPGPQGGGRQGAPQPGRGTQQPQAGAGVTSVVSKSKETAIRNHRGATTYNQWTFQPVDDLSGPGFTAPGRGGGNQPGAGQPGQQGPGRGQPGRGNPPGTGAPAPQGGFPGPRGGGPGGRGPGRGGLE